MALLAPTNTIARKNESELSVRLVNGSLIELKGADSTNKDSLRGVGLDGIVFDEYALMDETIGTEIIRPALSDRQGWALYIGTPKGKNHFYDLYNSVDNHWLYTIEDTKLLKQEEVDGARAEMSPDEFLQEYMCGWLYFAGLIYKEFDETKHIIEPFAAKKEWNVYISIDHGLTNPTAILFFMVDTAGTVYLFDEHYEAGKPVSYHAKAIRNKLTGHKLTMQNVKTIYIDPSAKAKSRERDGQPWSVVDEYLDYGISTVAASNEVLAGINRVKEHLLRRQLFVFKNCVHTIREFSTYRWKPKNAVDRNTPEEPVKLNDHALDSVRYLIFSRAQRARAQEPDSLYKYQLKPLMMGRSQKEKDWYND